MPVYEYIAIGTNAQRQTGTLVADSPRQAREQLREMELLAQTVCEPAKNVLTSRQLFEFKRPNQVSILIRELSTLSPDYS